MELSKVEEQSKRKTCGGLVCRFLISSKDCDTYRELSYAKNVLFSKGVPIALKRGKTVLVSEGAGYEYVISRHAVLVKSLVKYYLPLHLYLPVHGDGLIKLYQGNEDGFVLRTDYYYQQCLWYFLTKAVRAKRNEFKKLWYGKYMEYREYFFRLYEVMGRGPEVPEKIEPEYMLQNRDLELYLMDYFAGFIYER